MANEQPGPPLPPPPGSGWSAPAPRAPWTGPPPPGQEGLGPGSLRPLGVGDVLDRMFRLIARHWRAYTIALGALLLLPYTVVAVLQHQMTGGFGLMAMFSDPTAFDTGPVPGGDIESILWLYLAIFLLLLFVSPLTTGVAVRIAAEGIRDQRPEPGPALAHGGRRYPALFLAMFLSWFLPALTFAPGVGSIIAGAVSESPPPVVVGVILVLLAIPAAVAVSMLLLFSVPVVIVEGTGPLAALRRSAGLVRRRFWPVLGITLLAWLIAYLVASFVVWPLSIAALLVGGVLALVLNAIGGTISGLMGVALAANAQTLLYYDARVRVEGLDLQLMTQQLAGRDPHARAG